MAVYSSFLRQVANFSTFKGLIICNNTRKIVNAGQVRKMGLEHNQFIIQPSRFQFKKFKDLLHYFVMLGVVPISTIVIITNIFVGPAALTETPEDYVPKYWEYHRHPISRFLAKYIYPSPQQEYEKMCHFLFEENEKAQIRKLESQVKNKMAARNDYQAYYFRPAIAKYHRISKEAAEYLESIRGDN